MEQQEKEITQDNTTPKKEVKLYDYAHLVVYCGKCKSKYIVEENVPKNRGIQINLPPTSEAEVRLICKDCKNEMGLFYIESTKKDDTTIDKESITEKETTNDTVQEASTDSPESV